MTQHGSGPIFSNGQTEAQKPLSDIELHVLNQMLEGYSLAEIVGNTGYSGILVSSVLKSIEKKTGSKNLVQATAQLVKSGVLKA